VLTKPLVYAVLTAVATLAVSCNNSGNTTIINGLDCNLVRDDLVGTWTVNLGTGSPTLQNCTTDIPPLPPGLNLSIVGTNDFPATYSPMDVFGSDGSTSFRLQADRTGPNNDTINPELTGSVQADSCLAMVRVWDRTDALFFQCIGTFNLTNHTLSGACDSAEIDTNVDGQLDTSCSLSSDVSFTAGIQ
jgi:hypothetical protein